MISIWNSRCHPEDRRRLPIEGQHASDCYSAESANDSTNIMDNNRIDWAMRHSCQQERRAPPSLLYRAPCVDT